MPSAIAERLAASRLMRLQEVKDATSMCKAAIYRMIKEDEFPRPVVLSKRRVAWKQKDVVGWLEARK